MCCAMLLCQGSVTGLLEEVAGLVRRVEGLDEKLRIGHRAYLLPEAVRAKQRAGLQDPHRFV